MSKTDLAAVRSLIADVADPELPALTIGDLGVLRDVHEGADGRLEVTITPTYSGCPALDVIASDIRDCLAETNHAVVIRTVLSPAWTTDWISAEGRSKLAAYGIAPPGPTSPSGPVDVQIGVRCPLCGSSDTKRVSRFASTACQAHWVCRSCAEPFNEFKAH